VASTGVIGRALLIPETTAKTYFYRARKQLRTLAGSEFAYYGDMERQ
jgi:hypothetical protein